MRQAWVLAVLIAGAAWAADRECKYEPAVTAIEGVVKDDKTYSGAAEGPPERPVRLVLDAPISIVRSAKDDSLNEPVSDVRELQIVPNEIPDLKPYLDRRVKVTGKLFMAHTAHHYTKALIALDTMEEVKAPSKSTR
jgi:hypothetical protein